ncbi:MAG: LPP20 family lipoprotein [Nitrospirota bacterium]
MATRRPALAFGPSLVLASALLACATTGILTAREPDWVEGRSARYPDASYVTGVGRADNPEAAEDRAYAAVSRVFSAQISQRTTEWERYLQADDSGKTASQRDISIDQVTKVSTGKVLEHVAIAERYHNANTGAYYALATMDRRQAAATLRERIAGLDREIDALLHSSQRSDDPLGRIRALHLAVRLLLLRDAYHTDLQIVDPSGRGADPLTRLRTVRLQLQRDLEQHVHIALEVTGDEPAAIRSALTQGLNTYGLPVSGADGAPADIVIRGAATFESVDHMPQGPFVRWTASFDLLDRSTDQIIGSIRRNGREGHLTEPEARARALRAAQHAVSDDAGRTLAAFLFGTDTDFASPPSSQEPRP